METFWQGFLTGIITCIAVVCTTLGWIEYEARKTKKCLDKNTGFKEI